MIDELDHLHLVVDRRTFWHAVFLIFGATALLAWAGLLTFLLANGTTAPATVAAVLVAVAVVVGYVAVHRRLRSGPVNHGERGAGKHTVRRGPATESSRSAARQSAMFLAAFTVALCLVVLYLLFASNGSGAVLAVLAVPVLATVVGLFAYRAWKRALLHRSGD